MSRIAHDIVRREILFTGRVQGVGFRFTARSIASAYPISGYVRNMPNGSVQLVAEGAGRNVDRFLRELRDRMGDFIDFVEEHDSPPTGEFGGFGIRY